MAFRVLLVLRKSVRGQRGPVGADVPLEGDLHGPHFMKQRNSWKVFFQLGWVNALLEMEDCYLKEPYNWSHKEGHLFCIAITTPVYVASLEFLGPECASALAASPQSGSLQRSLPWALTCFIW